MDGGHVEILERLSPPEQRAKIRMLIRGQDVPDPYYGGVEGFERVLDMVEGACFRLLDELRQRA